MKKLFLHLVFVPPRDVRFFLFTCCILFRSPQRTCWVAQIFLFSKAVFPLSFSLQLVWARRRLPPSRLIFPCEGFSRRRWFFPARVKVRSWFVFASVLRSQRLDLPHEHSAAPRVFHFSPPGFAPVSFLTMPRSRFFLSRPRRWEAACALSAPLFSAVDSDLEFVFFPDVLLPAYFVCFLISAPACCFLLAAVFPVSSVLDSYSDFFFQALVASFYSAVPFLFLFLFGALCFAAGEKFLLGILVPTCTHHF
jgi:hypothetical protein